MFPLLPPTDREKQAPDRGVGVDTVAIAGPTSERLLQCLRAQEFDRMVGPSGQVVDIPRSSSAVVAVGLGWARLFGYRQDGQAYIRVELSLPKVFHGHNRNALSPQMLFDALDASLTWLDHEFSDIPQIDEVHVQRLDLVRDIHNVLSPPATLEAVGSRHIPHATYHDRQHRSDGALQTLTRGTRSSYLVRGYDKQHEMQAAARRERDPGLRQLLRSWAAISRGQLRFELELRPPELKRVGLHTVGECEQDKLEQVARQGFQRARWDMPYASRREALGRLEALQPSLSSRDYRNLVLYVLAQEVGVETGLTRHAIEAVRPIARRHSLLDGDVGHGLRRLCFDTGREILVE